MTAKEITGDSPCLDKRLHATAEIHPRWVEPRYWPG